MFSVGELLKREREKKNLTLQQVEKATKVRLRYLQAVEANDWDSFSSKVYISGVLQTYSKFLGMDPKKAMAYFQRDYEKKEELKFKKRVSSKYFRSETKKFITAAFIGIFLIFGLYFGYQLKIYLSPPNIAITQPTKTIFRNVEKIRVEGKTDKDATVTIFGDQIFPNKEGIFIYDYPLRKGKNKLVIDVIGANGRTSQLTQEYILE